MLHKLTLLLASILFATALTACAAPAAQTTEAPAAEEAAPESADAEATEALTEEDSAEMASGEEVIYAVDTAASSVAWRGSKILVDWAHHGTVDINEGIMTFVGDQLVGSSFAIDMTSINVTDEMSAGDKTDLTGHLNSDDFFGTATYPTAMLVIKSAEPTDTAGEYAAVADLTIKEITNEITFLTNVDVGDGTLTATSDIVFDRAAFDVRYGSGSFFDDLGDQVISDEIELSVALVANS